MGAISSVIIGLALVGSWDTPVRHLMKDVQKVTSVSSQESAPVPEVQELPAPAPATAAVPAGETTDIYAESKTDIDIYAPKAGKKKRRVKLQRTAGDTDVILVPSARPLPEGDVNISLDELLLWRVSMGVTDDLTLEANSMWGFSAGLEGKYALIRRNNTALSLAAGATALTIDKHYNASHLSLLYAKDFPAGALHAGGHMVFAHGRDDDAVLIPQLTLGAEAKLMKRVTALGEIGFGNDILNATNGYENNTGFANLGMRVSFKQIYATGSLFMPTNERFLNSRALGIPFVRIGGTF